MSVERAARTVNGWIMLLVDIALYVGATALYILAFMEGTNTETEASYNRCGGCSSPAASSSPRDPRLIGFFTLQPNEARVLILVGNYKGTSRETGFPLGQPVLRERPCRRHRGQRRAEQIPAMAKKTSRRTSRERKAATRSRCAPAP